MQMSPPTPAPLGLLVRRWPERRRVVLATALAALAAVLAAVVAAGDATMGLSYLAVVPVLLVALEFGRRGGLAVAALSFVVVLLAAAAERPEVGVAAIATRGAVFLLAGAVAGRFSDRMRAAHAREERLLRSGLRLSEAGRREQLAGIAVSEAMRTTGVSGVTAGLDGLAAAHAGVLDGGRTVVPMVAHGVHVGTLEAYHAAAMEAEDLSALKLLARQVAIVAEGLRLLELDGERAALEARLREVRRELLESRSGTSLLLRAEEAGKRRAAEKLHEDLAQVLSAVLLSMRMLERQSATDGSAPLQELHEQVARVLSDVRDVARELRPVVLDQLGLAPALEALGRTAQEQGSQGTVAVGELPAAFRGDVETAVFRLVEDALAEGASVEVASRGDDVTIEIEIEAPAPDAVLALRARAESAGGTLSVRTPANGAAAGLLAAIPAR
jgi:signal transduction histidine kinase